MRNVAPLFSICLSWIALAFCANAEWAMAQVDVPYAASVIVNDAALRSGPGVDYYAVDLLPRGSNVEVYKNIEGWCAIRPPEGSFSWVPARHLRLGASGKIAEVIEPKAIAWIGSNLSRPKEHMYQVKLERGETVAICGETRFERKKEQITETWYKIEPPAGEFRWIETRFLSKPKSSPSELIASEGNNRRQVGSKGNDFPQPESGEPNSTLSKVPVALASNDQPSAASIADAEPVVEQEPAPLSPKSVRAATPLTRPTSPRKTGFHEVTQGRYTLEKIDLAGAGSTTSGQRGSPNQQATFVTPTDDGAANAPRSFDGSRSVPAQFGNFNSAMNDPQASRIESLGASDFDTQLKNLESQLGIAVSMHPVDWNLNTLRDQANQLINRGSTPLERARASMLADRINLYETHQKRTIDLEMQQSKQAAASPQSGTILPATEAPWKPTESAAVTSEQPSEPSSKEPDEKNASWMDKVAGAVGNGLKGAAPESTPTHFDAKGKLQKVIAKDQTVKYPPYALLDDDGKVVAFVGSPVVKLDKYVGKEVGVYGRRGLHSASQTTYIEAVELVDLEVANRSTTTPGKPLRTTFGVMK